MSCKDMPSFDNASPRSFIDRVRRLEKQTPTTKRYLRAEAAQQNGHENLPLFAAALIVANYAGLSKSELNWTAGAYLASRVVYNVRDSSHVLPLLSSPTWYFPKGEENVARLLSTPG